MKYTEGFQLCYLNELEKLHLSDWTVEGLKEFLILKIWWGFFFKFLPSRDTH